MKLVKGNELPEALRSEVLRAYVYRGLDTTCKDDSEWLAAHAFYVTKRGTLARNIHHCEPHFLADKEIKP
jgi:hypothetical protein